MQTPNVVENDMKKIKNMMVKLNERLDEITHDV